MSHVYLIAELGINTHGDFDICRRMLDAAVEAQFDAAKFQFFRAANLYPPNAGRLDWQNEAGERCSYDVYETLKSNELTMEWLDRAKVECDSRGIAFLSSVFSFDTADDLKRLGARVFKLSSSSIDNIPLIEHVAAAAGELIVSTGGASLGQIEEAVQSAGRHEASLTLLHCNLSYPTKPEEASLSFIPLLRTLFPGARIGYSDHTEDPVRVPKQAVYAGAEILEKHITLDKKGKGPDHFFALTPPEMKVMSSAVREAEEERRTGAYILDSAVWGSPLRQSSGSENYLRGFISNQLFAVRNIEEGTTISHKDIAILRRGTHQPGLSPKYYYLFRDLKVTARQPIAAYTPLTWEKII